VWQVHEGDALDKENVNTWHDDFGEVRECSQSGGAHECVSNKTIK